MGSGVLLWMSPLIHSPGDRRFSGRWKSYRGVLVAVTCPSCPDSSLEPPGPGRIIRNMLGWSLLEKTDRSGVWLFRGAPSGGESFFFPCRFWRLGQWERKGSYHTAWAVPLWFPHALVHMRVGKAPLSGHILESGAGHCSLVCGGLIAPLMQPWCAEGEVPTAREPEPLPGMELVCWLALRRRTFVWKAW